MLIIDPWLTTLEHLIAVVGAAVACMASVYAAWKSWHNGRQLQQTGAQIQGLRIEVNHRLEELLTSRQQVGYAAGQEAQRTEQRTEEHRERP